MLLVDADFTLLELAQMLFWNPELMIDLLCVIIQQLFSP